MDKYQALGTRIQEKARKISTSTFSDHIAPGNGYKFTWDDSQGSFFKYQVFEKKRKKFESQSNDTEISCELDWKGVERIFSPSPGEIDFEDTYRIGE
ncbi:hypothetical protein AYI68_g6415 [Smittium mucronatum]|uniref:Uncharacterized protein n=1 Tax=Smittium mucronatum TaxID=133383 RepID=A0A1R0GRK1_9FUNG|nr:hypothetical protein AYI68_g6415 [Smittium mucronatum]